jgi:hypothetical protein
MTCWIHLTPGFVATKLTKGEHIIYGGDLPMIFRYPPAGRKNMLAEIGSVCVATQETAWRTISSVCSVRCTPMCAYRKIFPRAFSRRDRSVGCFRCKQPQSGNNSMLSFPSRARGRGRKINQSLKIKDLVSFLNATHEASSSSAWCLSSIWMGPGNSSVQRTAVSGGARNNHTELKTGKSRGKRQFARPRQREQNNLKFDFCNVGYNELLNLASDNQL